MTARSGFTVSNGATIATTWGNGVRDHIVPIGTTNDVSSEGQLASNTSTNKVVVHDGTSARTLVAYGEWDSWIGTAGTIQDGGGAALAYQAGAVATYTMIGRTVLWRLQAQVQSVSYGTSGGSIKIGLPVAADTTLGAVGSGYYYDASTGVYYPAVVTCAVSATLAGINSTAAAQANINVGAQVGYLDVNDFINLAGSYEAAA